MFKQIQSQSLPVYFCFLCVFRHHERSEIMASLDTGAVVIIVSFFGVVFALCCCFIFRNSAKSENQAERANPIIHSSQPSATEVPREAPLSVPVGTIQPQPSQITVNNYHSTTGAEYVNYEEFITSPRVSIQQQHEPESPQRLQTTAAIQSTANRVNQSSQPLTAEQLRQESLNIPMRIVQPQSSQTGVDNFNNTTISANMDYEEFITSSTTRGSTLQQRVPEPPPRLQRTAATQATSENDSSRNLDDLRSFMLTGDHGEEMCPVCFDELKTQMVSVGQCLHFVHTSCLKQWVSRDKSNACPVCRIEYEF